MATVNRLKTAIDVGGAVALIVIAVVIGWRANDMSVSALVAS